MTIHHSQVRKAEKMGVALEERDDLIRAFWPKRAVQIFGVSPGDAMQQMQAAMALVDGDDVIKLVADADAPRLVNVYNAEGHILKGSPMPPQAAHKVIKLDKNAEWEDPTPYTNELSANEREALDDTILGIEDLPEVFYIPTDSDLPDPVVERSAAGVALNGAIAYKEGTPAGDCPYSSEDEEDDEYENFVRWNDEWDAAADEAEEEEGTKGGSVVSEKYRAKYAEAGHPTHCGDWLAEKLNSIVLNKAGVNLELFEEICGLNGVDTSKYRRSGIGWQGRIRMTGRNLLAKKVYMAGGVLVLPMTIDGGAVKAPAEWMATQRYKMPKSEQDKPIPTGEVIKVASK